MTGNFFFLLPQIIELSVIKQLINIIELMLILVQKFFKKISIFLFRITNFYICK